MPDEIVIVDEQGTEHHFPAGMDPKQAIQIVRNANLKAANDRPLKEPTTFGAGAMKGANDYATELGQGMFESAAHPKTAGDFLGLMLPTSMGTAGPNVLKGLKSVGESEPIGNKAVRGAARVGAEALDLTPNIIQSKAEEKVIKGLRDFSKKPEPRWVDRNLPSKSGYKPGDVGVQSEELPTSSAAQVESPQETLIRRAQAPTSVPPVESGTPYGGVEVPHKVKKPRMGMEVTNPYGKDEAVHDELLKRMGAEPLPDDIMADTVGPGPVPEEAAPANDAQSIINRASKAEAAKPENQAKIAALRDQAQSMFDESMAKINPAKPMLKADEVAEAGRRLYGSRDAGRMLRPNDPKGGAEAIKRMAPGPSRLPLTAEARINGMPQEQSLEDALKQIILSRSPQPPE